MLAQLTTTAEEQRAVADTRAQRGAAFRDHLAAASAALASQDLQRAADRIAKALELRPDDAEARWVQASIERVARKTAKPAGRRKRPATDDESDLKEE